MRSHQWIDERSRALHVAVAAKLEANPDLVSIARNNLARWRERSHSAAFDEWKRVLEVMTLPELLALLRSPAERAACLRQSSPFAGLLTRPERDAILREYDARRS